MTRKDIVIKATDVCFQYDKQEVLSNVSFSIGEGEYVGIIGPNGGGKTTLLQLLLGLLCPCKGEISVFQNNANIQTTEMGYVPQALQFDASFPLSTLDLVLMGRLSHLPWWGKYRKKDQTAAYHALEKVHLAHLAHTPFSQLSGGQKQRALIARALTDNPKILILDEPTNNLDSSSRDEIYELLDQLKKSTTIIMVTHDLQLVLNKVDVIFCVEKTLSEMSPKKVCEHFALGLYHHPLVESDCPFNPNKEK